MEVIESAKRLLQLDDSIPGSLEEVLDMKRVVAVLGLLALVFAGSLATWADAYVPGTPMKVGFIYVGPIGDYGWTFAHNEARLAAMEELPWLLSFVVETVPEGSEEAVIDELIQQRGVDIVFTTSFGFMNGTYSAALRYPDKIFAHASGFTRAPNMMTYMADFYQVYYLNGIIAGALTETNKIGYVGAFPIPEVKRHLNAFALGIQAVNPDAEVLSSWIFEWFSPGAAKEATEALIADGCDIFAFTEDSPTVVQVAAENDMVSFGHYGSQMYQFAPDYVVSGQAVRWEAIYIDFLQKVYDGVYTANNLQNVDYWWLLAQDAVAAEAQPNVPINPLYEDELKAYMIDDPVLGNISAYDLFYTRLAQFSEPGVTFDPFQGPIIDRNGVLRVPEGMWLSVDSLITMEWAASNVVGPWPNEPE